MFGEEITHYAPLAEQREDKQMGIELAKETVETGFWSKLQPWQALFGLLTYALGVYGIEDDKAIILYGFILATLGFVMVSNYKHKEAIKAVVAPWLVQQVLKILGDFLEPQLPEPPEEGPVEPIAEPDKEKVIAELKEAIQALDENMKE